MKGIIFKLVVIFLLTVAISVTFGYATVQEANRPDFVYTVNGVVQTDFSPIVLGLQVGTMIFVVLTFIFAWFYITNISIFITTYKGTKPIENENIVYQRDLSDDYNSAIASYIIDGTIETKQDYQAVLVELEEKGLIYKKNEKYNIKDTYKNSDEKLLANQQVVLEQINEGRINFKGFKRAVINDAMKLGYVKLNTSLMLVLFLSMFICPISIFLLIYMIISASPYMMILTENGKMEKDKIIKLKRYLISFSNLNDLETTDNNIWGEYLAYAISLKVNKKLKVREINLR